MLPWLYAACCRVLLIAAAGGFFLILLVFASLYPVIIPVLFLLGGWQEFQRRRKGGWTHGTAREASNREREAAALHADDGVILGRVGGSMRPRLWEAVGDLLSPRVGSAAACQAMLAALFTAAKERKAGQMLRTRNHVHLATFAPAGGGKGVSVLIPNMLTYSDSCVVTDPKGEAYLHTARHRMERFGHRIFVLAPFGIAGRPGRAASSSNRFNPMDWLDPEAEEFLDDCKLLANSLIFRQGTEHDPHWNDSAEIVLTAFIAYIAACEPERSKRNLNTLRLIVSSRKRFMRAVEAMQAEQGFRGVVAKLGNMVGWFEDRELASVLTTVQRHTAFLDSPAVARNVETTDFDARTLRYGRATLYLSLPHDRLETLAALQRMWITSIMLILTRGQVTEKNPVLWLLDECAHLGRVPILETAVTLMRGMGMRLWFFFQSVEQVKLCFGEKAASILDNIGTQQFFAINSYETADYISKRIGDMTIRLRSKNGNYSTSTPVGNGAFSQQSGGSMTRGGGWSDSDTARRLLKPEEILVRPSDEALIFHRNLPVIRAELIRYFECPELVTGTRVRRSLGIRAGFQAGFVLVASYFCLLMAASEAVPEAMPSLLTPLWASIEAVRTVRAMIAERAAAAAETRAEDAKPERGEIQPSCGRMAQNSGRTRSVGEDA